MNFCCNGGSLVDGRTPFPEDHTDYYAHPSFGLIGCNQLWCSGCRSFVRSAAGISFALPDMRVDMNALYDRAELMGGPELMATYPERRLYLCRCSRWLEAFTRPVHIPDPQPGTDPRMPWQCGGHLVRVLPCEIDGASVENEAEVAALAEKAFAGFAGPTARHKEAAAWPARIYALLRGTPAGELVAEAAAARLADPDPVVRGRAIRFFFIFPLPTGVNIILDALDGDRSLYAGVATEPWEWRGNRTLEESLWWVVTQFLDTSERVRELSRKEVVTPGRGQALYVEMMLKDGPWMVEHVEEIVRANLALVPKLLDDNWQNHDDPRAILRRIAGMREVSPAVFMAFAERQRLDARDRELIASHVGKR